MVKIPFFFCACIFVRGPGGAGGQRAGGRWRLRAGPGPRGPPGGLGAPRARPRAGPGEGLRGGAAARGERGRPGSARSAAGRAVALRRRRPRPAARRRGPTVGRPAAAAWRAARGPRRRRVSGPRPSPPAAAGMGPRPARRP
ncbi:unnamed protein product [Nyctereutes procyonoides]|uniref:(raccoon dog) hypothetical protein n=1 Tax=Nyctereutes procyonoides TaxID=34880 RepID=A0A811ZEP4_NYCPR|nr:unnamed protein product [Nyctereutes procyonoides]